MREVKLTLHDAGRQQRRLAGTAVEPSVQQVPLQLLVNLIARDLFFQSQRIRRVEFHAEAEQNRIHVCNRVYGYRLIPVLFYFFAIVR